MEQIRVATIQVAIPEADEAGAQDFLSEGMQRSGVLDWQYLAVGGQMLTPTPKYVETEDYEEGDAFADL